MLAEAKVFLKSMMWLAVLLLIILARWSRAPEEKQLIRIIREEQGAVFHRDQSALASILVQCTTQRLVCEHEEDIALL